MKSLPTGPFTLAAKSYAEAGWRPLPLPAKRKSSPPEDWTGSVKKHSAEMPSFGQLAEWAKQYPNGNVAISPPKTVLGIDVDAYGDKAGATTVLEAEREWGNLEDTWVSTSRSDGVSGIRWYRIPSDLAWPGKLPQGGGVEIIRWDHRYAVVSPSIHPEGGEYRWVRPDGEDAEDEFPAPEELPALPEGWVTGLTSGKKWVQRSEVELDDSEVATWIEDRGDFSPCAVMDRTVRKHLDGLRHAGPDGGAHEHMLNGVWAVIGDAQGGHKGVSKALERLKKAFWEASKDRRSSAEAASEWKRALAGGVQKVVAEGEPEDEDLCELEETSRAPKERKRVGATDVYPRNDAGNARRFATRYRDSVRWVAAFDNWFVWSDRLNIWVADVDGEAMRMAQETAATIRQEAEFEEDPKERASIRKFATASANEGKLKSMLSVAKTLKGMSVPAETLNSRRDLVVCLNGTVLLPKEFSGESVRRVTSIQEHYNTIHTGTNWTDHARLADWDKFLERFQPDLEVREWLQKLAGYSLLGSNPRRLMLVAIGDTSTGKSTFAEAVSGALGAYAGSANMTIFRDNQDDRARPDIIRVLPMRFVYAEEASRSWHLHPDQIKRLTGGTPITARGMRSNVYVDQVPAFTPWLVTNHAPTIEGADAALWRRVLAIPFDVQIPKTEEDARFRDKLASDEGRAAILAWLMDGYRAYLADPDSVQRIPAGAMIANAKFRAEVSDLAVFINDYCVTTEDRDDPAYWTEPDSLYQAYQTWCSMNGVQSRDVMSGTKFGREVNGEYPKTMKRIDGKPKRIRVGIKIRQSVSRAG